MRLTAPRRETLLFAAAFIAIALAGLLIAWYLYSGPNPFYDDVFYIEYAHALLQGRLTFIENSFSYSFLNLVPIAASFLLFGYSNISAILPSVIEYVAVLCLTALIAVRVSSKAFSLVAVLFAATFPFVVGYVSRVLPDINLGLAISLSVYLFLLGTEKRRGRMFYFVSGLAAAYTIYVKNVGFLYILLFAAAMLASVAWNSRVRKHRKAELLHRVLPSYVALAVGIALYLLAFYIGTGNPLFGFVNYSTSSSSYSFASEAYLLLSPNTQYVVQNLNGFEIYPLGAGVLLAVLGTAIGIRTKNWRINYVSFFNWAIFLYLIFGTSSLHSYVQVPTVSRFFAANAVLLAVLCGYALFAIADYAAKALRAEKGMRHIVALLIVLPIVTLVLVNCLPIYGNIKKGDLISINNTEIFSGAVGYLTNVSQGNRVDVFLSSQQGFALDGIHFLSFMLGYGGNMRLYTAAFYDNISLLSVNQSRSCVYDPEVRAYVLDIGKLTTPFMDSLQQANMENWLGGNCTISLNATFSAANTTDLKIYLYRIGAPSP